jgi:hypothetical protein
MIAPQHAHAARPLRARDRAFSNIAERRTCKRCGALLTPTPEEQAHILATSHQRRIPWGWLSFFLTLCGLMGIALIKAIYFPDPPTVPQPGSVIDIRADGIAILRMVTTPPYEGIEIHADGAAFRFFYPVQMSDPSKIMLTTDEQQAMQSFRLAWCKELPAFRSLAPSEPFYDLGVRCGGYEVKQAKVPIDQLPTILQQILHKIPRPNNRSS